MTTRPMPAYSQTAAALRAALAAEAATVDLARIPPPPAPVSRWQGWRARRRAVAAAMDAGYRLSPAAYERLRRTV